MYRDRIHQMTSINLARLWLAIQAEDRQQQELDAKLAGELDHGPIEVILQWGNQRPGPLPANEVQLLAPSTEPSNEPITVEVPDSGIAAQDNPDGEPIAIDDSGSNPGDADNEARFSRSAIVKSTDIYHYQD